MSDPIRKALKEANIPDSSRRREDVAILASRGHADDAEQSRPSGRSVSRWRASRRMPIGALAALVLTAFLSLTPPGRALASDIAELVGIGDEPTLDQSKDQDLAASGRAVVVSQGTIPGTDQIYEISAYEAGGSGSEASNKPNSCLNFDLPGLDRQRQVNFDSVCIDRPLTEPLYVGGASDNLSRLDPDARFSISGLLSDEVADVSVTYEDASGSRMDVPVALALLDTSVAEQIGAPFTFGRFEAFFPDDGLPGEGPGVFGHPFFSTVEVVAYDADREQIGKDNGRKFVQPPASVVASGAFKTCGEVDPGEAAPSACQPITDKEAAAQAQSPGDLQRAVELQFKDLIVAARDGQLKANVAPEKVIRLMEMALDPPQGARAGKRLENKMIALIEELRAAGDLPPSGRGLKP